MSCILLSGQREGGSGPALMLSTKMYHLKGSNYVDSCEIAESPAIGDLIPRRFDPRISAPKSQDGERPCAFSGDN